MAVDVEKKKIDALRGSRDRDGRVCEGEVWVGRGGMRETGRGRKSRREEEEEEGMRLVLLRRIICRGGKSWWLQQITISGVE